MSLAVVNSHRADRIWKPARHPSRTDLSGLLGCVLRRRRFCCAGASGRGRGPDGICGPGGRRHVARAEAGAGRSGVLEGRLVGGAEGTIEATTSRSGPFFDEAVHSSHPDRRAKRGKAVVAQTLNAEKQTAQEQSVEAGATSRRGSLGSRACLYGTGLRRIRPRGLVRRAAHSVQGSLSARSADF